MKFTDLITENDNATLCPGRVAILLGVIIFSIIACWVAYKKAEIDLQGFGTGYGTLIGAGMGGLWLKSKQEHQ